MSLGTFSNRETPTGQILEYLQRNGSATIKEIEQLLGITTNAVRQHLSNLSAGGFVERRRVNAGIGRPHHAYLISEKARELFACHCDDLALTLLEEVFQIEGKERVSILLERVSNRLAKKYAESVRSTLMKERVEELASALDQRGVLADVETEDDKVVLKTYNCPFHELAQEHREICAMDKNMMEKVLGTDVRLQGSVMDGYQCCSFEVVGSQS